MKRETGNHDTPRKGGQAPTLLFLHIPKAAGTTLIQIIKRQYGVRRVNSLDGTDVRHAIEEFAALPEKKRASYKCVQGHFIYGFHELVPRPYTYITMVREPVDRILSQYYYIVRFRKHYLHKEITGKGWTLADYVRSGITPELENCMTKAIAGLEIPYGETTQEAYGLAERNLREGIALAGLSEKFDESLLLFKRMFGWRNPYYIRENVTPSRPAREKIDEETARIIEANNRYDMQLYRVACELFKERLRQHSEGFEEELARFRKWNRHYSRAKSIVRKVRYTVFPPREK